MDRRWFVRPVTLRRVAAHVVIGAALWYHVAVRHRAAVSPLVHAPVIVVATPRVEPLAQSPRIIVVATVASAGTRIPVQLTAYCLRGYTRTGEPVREGVVAADPRLFPLRRYVDVFLGKRRMGRYYVGDSGSAVRGRILDIWLPDCADAIRFGRRRGSAALVAKVD